MVGKEGAIRPDEYYSRKRKEQLDKEEVGYQCTYGGMEKFS